MLGLVHVVAGLFMMASVDASLLGSLVGLACGVSDRDMVRRRRR